MQQKSKSQIDIKVEKLVKGMTSLNLMYYGSADIGRFDQCVNRDPERYWWAVDTAKTNLETAGTPTMGLMGTGVNSRSGMAETALKVRERKIGVCHELAQLGADHLLKQMDAGIIPRSSIKIVSHKAGFSGSHTFLLLDHTGSLTDLSKCVIVDPWAVTMGFIDTQGVYTANNYPYMSIMTTNLQLVFEVDAKGNEIKHTAEKFQKKVVPPEERGDREKVRASQEPVDFQSVLKRTGNRDALLSGEKPSLPQSNFESPVVSQPKPQSNVSVQQTVKPAVAENSAPRTVRALPSAPAQAPVETQRHRSIFHDSSPVKPSVSAEEVRLLMGNFHKALKGRDTASNKAEILRQLAFSVRDEKISPEKGLLLAVDLMMTEDTNVSETTWKRSGEPTIDTLKEVFSVINNFDEPKSISNCLRNYSGLEESKNDMRNKPELIRVSNTILADPEVVRDIKAQNISGLRV